MLFQRTDRFHQRTFEVIADTHNLTGCFHLCGQCTSCTDKFIKWQTRNLDNTVVNIGSKACISLSGNGIRDLIQSVSQSDLRCYFAIGYPVALTASAEERLTRGFTSITQYSKLSGFRAYCTLHPPVIPSSVMMFSAEVRSIWYSLSPSV